MYYCTDNDYSDYAAGHRLKPRPARFVRFPSMDNRRFLDISDALLDPTPMESPDDINNQQATSVPERSSPKAQLNSAPDNRSEFYPSVHVYYVHRPRIGTFL